MESMAKESNHLGNGYISSDDGFSSLVEKALLAEDISCDNVASKIENIVVPPVNAQLSSTLSRWVLNLLTVITVHSE